MLYLWKYLKITTMKKQIYYVMSLFVAAFLLLSCEKYNESDDLGNNKEANSILILRAQAKAEAAETNATISYPVNIYVFHNDQCVEKIAITSVDEQLSLKMPEGNYNVYAIAGADEETYNLPTKEDATKESVIALKNDKTHKDLMTAQNTVNLAYGEENTLVLSLSRKVMQIESITINNVPSNVTAVTVSISPLYQNLLLNGDYSAEKEDIQTITLTKEGESNVWKNTTGIFLLEASASATIKVSLTTSSVTKSYSYSSTQELKANHKIYISGTYYGDGIKLNGTITGATWDEPIDITFNFDDNGSSTEENNGNEDNNDDVTTGDSPLVGTAYKECYVLKSEKSGNNTVLTLMSATEKNSLDFTKGDQESIKAATENAIQELAVDGISGWRLPTQAEIEYVQTNLSNINNNIEALGFTRITPNAQYWYYFTTSESQINVFNIIDGRTISNLSPNSPSYVLRAFATVTITN